MGVPDLDRKSAAAAIAGRMAATAAFTEPGLARDIARADAGNELA